jgi:inner membrane protein
MSRWGWVLKTLAIGFLSLLLLIPLGMINGTISERMKYRAEAVASVAQSFAGAQTVVGPVLVVPFDDENEIVYKDEKGVETRQKVVTPGHWLYFPESLDLRGVLKPDIRNRGLHKVRVYELQMHAASHFHTILPTPPSAQVIRRVGQAYLSFSITDVRGLVGTPVLTLDGRVAQIGQGPGKFREGFGIHANIPAVQPGQTLDFKVDLDAALGGTETLAISPIARSNRITLDSDWPSPSFAGRFLPRTLSMGEHGFHAAWDISSLAAATQSQYEAGGATNTLDSLQLTLIDPVNVYTQADRASKYGILFVLLTFVGFFMFELIKRLAIHPIQYGLVGLALAIFFLLLLSLSEHIEFWIAYLIASAACISLLGVYLASVLKSRARGAGFALMLTVLYAALYGLLISEDNALVLGSLMLFAILATIMIVTRKIDWYALGTTNATESV